MYLYQVSSREQFIFRERGPSKARDSRWARTAAGSPSSSSARKTLDARRACTALTELTDNRLISRLEKLRGEERTVQLKILYYLNEMERRRLYLPRGYSSLFEFCTGHLKYSKPAAMRRINAARCIERFPRVSKLLLSGRLSLTVVSMISKVLTRDNAAEILSWAVGKSTRDVEMLVSRHRPGHMTRDRVKPVCVMTPVEPKGASKCQADLTFSSGAGTKCKASLTSGDGSKSPDNKPDTKNTGVNNPPGEELERVMIEQCFKLEFMVKAEFMQKIKRLRALLSNKYPKGLEFESLFEILLDDYLERNAPEARAMRREQRKKRSSDNKQEALKQPRGSSDPVEKTRHIPKALQDKVYIRDKGRCTYRSPDGKRCGRRRNLQIDHKVPYAKGGANTLSNLRLLCAKHNRLEAERVYGKDFMKKHYLRE